MLADALARNPPGFSVRQTTKSASEPVQSRFQGLKLAPSDLNPTPFLLLLFFIEFHSCSLQMPQIGRKVGFEPQTLLNFPASRPCEAALQPYDTAFHTEHHQSPIAFWCEMKGTPPVLNSSICPTGMAGMAGMAGMTGMTGMTGMRRC